MSFFLSLQRRSPEAIQNLPTPLIPLRKGGGKCGVTTRKGGGLLLSLRDSRSESWQSIDNQKDTAPFALFFFTTTCGVCKAQIPILQEIADELADENTKIYGILGNAPSADLAQKYAKSNAITLPIFYESKAKRFFTQIIGGVKGVPVIVIFKDGKTKERFMGLIPKGVIKKALNI